MGRCAISSLNLTTVALSAAQFLGILDSGEGLSTAQKNDALAAANQLLESWYTSQVVAIRVQLAAFTLAAGTYTPATMLQFADLTTPISFPAGWDRAMILGLAVEIAPQYDMQPPQEVVEAAGKAYTHASPPVASSLAAGQREG